MKKWSSRPEEFRKKAILRKLSKFAGKHLCQSLFFNKVADQRLATSLKKRLAQGFSCEFCEISKSTFFHRTPLVAASEKKRLGTYSGPIQTSRMNYFCKNKTTWNKFRKKLDVRCLRGSLTQRWLSVPKSVLMKVAGANQVDIQHY